MEVKYILPLEDKEEQREHFHFTFNVWLRKRVEKREFVSSPKIKVVGKGLESLTKRLDKLKNRVSRTKLVIKI